MRNRNLWTFERKQLKILVFSCVVVAIVRFVRVQDQVHHHGVVDPHNFNVLVTNTVSVSIFVITFAKMGLQSENVLGLHGLFDKYFNYRALLPYCKESYERQLIYGEIVCSGVEMVETQMDDCRQRKCR